MSNHITLLILSVKRRLFIAFMLISIIIIGTSTAEFYIKIQTNKALNVIDVSGKQRMLSQRIILTAFEFISFYEESHRTHPFTEQNILDEMKKSIDIFEENHQNILYGSQSKNIHPAPNTILNFYSNGEKSLNQDITDFIQNARALHTLLNSISTGNADFKTEHDNVYTLKNTLINTAIFDLLSRLDEAVKKQREYHQKNIDILRYISPSLALILFLSFYLIWTRVFIPLKNRVVRTTKAIDELHTMQAKERYRINLAVENSRTGIWDWDLKTDFFILSPVLQRMVGVDFHEDNYMSFYELHNLVHPADKDLFSKTLSSHKDNFDRFMIEFQIRHVDGHYVTIKMAGQSVPNKNHSPKRMVGIIEDLTETKEQEKQKNIFIKGMEACHIAFAIIDLTSPSRNFVYASHEFCEITGHSQASLRQKNMNVFTGPQTSMGDLDKIDYAINEGKKSSVKMRSYRANGTYFWNEITLSPIILNTNKPIEYYIVIFEDLTSSIEQEKQEILRQRNESLGELAASIAHEINNLLMPMSMAKDILKDELKEDCDPFAHEQLDIIVDFAAQAKDIVQGILTFSRKGSDDIKKAVIFDELSDAVHFIRNLLSNNTKIILNLPSDSDILTLEAMINSTEMKQIFTNMCRNAEQAMNGKPGEIEITLSKKNLTNSERSQHNLIASDFAKITIKDNGSGISEENINKIFEPLFTTKEIGEGTGLGLSVVQGIIRSWGGAITVESTQGQGTTFTIYIPIHKSQDDFSDLMDLLEDE